MNIKAYDDLSGYAPPEDRYFAIDTDTYDCAPDGRIHPVGMGPTPEAAIADLMEKLEDAEEEARTYARDNGPFGVGA